MQIRLFSKNLTNGIWIRFGYEVHPGEHQRGFVWIFGSKPSFKGWIDCE